MLFADLTNFVVRNQRQFSFDQRVALGSRFLAGVVHEELFERHHGVRLTAVGDLPGLEQAHEPVARSAFAVTRRAKARHVAEIDEPVHDFCQSSAVFHVELCGIFGIESARLVQFVTVAADAGPASAADLRDADFQTLSPGLCAFTGGHDHARIRHGDPKNRDNPFEDIVRDTVAYSLRIDVVSRSDTRNADGVRAASIGFFQMVGVHQHADKVVLVIVETKKDAAAHIVDARFHGAVHRLRVVGVVALRTGRMELLISLLVVGLLEEYVGADARILEFAIVLDCRGRDVHVHPANGTILVLDAVNRLDALEDILDRVFLRMFSGFDGEPFVSHILKGDDLLPDLILCQFFSRDVLVLTVIRAVHAAVDTVIGEIQRSKHDDTVAVKMLLDLLAQCEYLPDDLRVLAFQQGRGLCIREAFVFPAFFEDLVHELEIIFMFLRKSQRFFDLRIVDELFRFF